MLKNLICTLSLVFSFSNLQAAERVGNWLFQVKGENFELFTANESSSMFGYICKDEDCYFYLQATEDCNDEAAIAVLVNFTNGTGMSEAVCHHFQKKSASIPILKMDDEFLFEGLKNSAEVGFGIALAQGQFKVSKFSMNGFTEALTLLRQRIQEGSSVDSGYQDMKL